MDNQQLPTYEKSQQYPNLPPYPTHEQQPIYPAPNMPQYQQPQPVHHHQTNIVAAPVMVSAVGPHPQQITCPSCGQHGKTIMRYESHSNTHRNALLMCIFCCWPCACLPYCMDSCRNGNHYCPRCNAFIGTYKS